MSWVLDSIIKAGWHTCPPCCVYALGTGNDLARSFHLSSLSVFSLPPPFLPSLFLVPISCIGWIQQNVRFSSFLRCRIVFRSVGVPIIPREDVFQLLQFRSGRCCGESTPTNPIAIPLFVSFPLHQQSLVRVVHPFGISLPDARKSGPSFSQGWRRRSLGFHVSLDRVPQHSLLLRGRPSFRQSLRSFAVLRSGNRNRGVYWHCSHPCGQGAAEGRGWCVVRIPEGNSAEESQEDWMEAGQRVSCSSWRRSMDRAAWLRRSSVWISGLSARLVEGNA